MKNSLFIYYNNGQFERRSKLNPTFLHLIEVGVVRVIADMEDGKAWVRGEDGIAVKETITEVSEP